MTTESCYVGPEPPGRCLSQEHREGEEACSTFKSSSRGIPLSDPAPSFLSLLLLPCTLTFGISGHRRLVSWPQPSPRNPRFSVLWALVVQTSWSKSTGFRIQAPVDWLFPSNSSSSSPELCYSLLSSDSGFSGLHSQQLVPEVKSSSYYFPIHLPLSNFCGLIPSPSLRTSLRVA